MRKVLFVIWTLPNTMLGLCAGFCSMLFGTRMQIREGCIEFHGGPIAAFLRRVPPGRSSSAMTLGHVVLGLDRHVLDVVREHEQVHVRQYERWGVLFLPAYLGASLWLALRGRDPYLDNPFEIEAYNISDPRGRYSLPPDDRLPPEGPPPSGPLDT